MPTRAGQAEAGADPVEGMQDVPADALVVGAVVVERVGEQDLGRFPGLGRAGQALLAAAAGDDLPEQDEQGQADGRRQDGAEDVAGGFQQGLAPLGLEEGGGPGLGDHLGRDFDRVRHSRARYRVGS
jgi:hypothetical protein